MGEQRRNAGRVLRFLVSGGWTDEDAEVVRELLAEAQRMATLVVADEGASAEVRARAQDFLDQLSSDMFG